VCATARSARAPPCDKISRALGLSWFTFLRAPSRACDAPSVTRDPRPDRVSRPSILSLDTHSPVDPHNTVKLAPIQSLEFPQTDPALSAHSDFLAGDDKMEDPAAQVMALAALDPEPISRPSSVSTQASAAQNLTHTIPVVSALAAGTSTADSPQPRSVPGTRLIPRGGRGEGKTDGPLLQVDG